MVGLTNSGSLSEETSRSTTFFAPSSRNIDSGSVTEWGVESPASLRTTFLAIGLLQAVREALAREPI